MNATQTLIFTWISVAPEFFNLALLIIGVDAMCHGIDIGHPLYIILFLNLIIPLAVTVINISAFLFINIEQYATMSNAMNGLSVEFHCNCWCICSIIRYIYMVHESWIHSRLPNPKLQCAIAIVITFATYVALYYVSYAKLVPLVTFWNFLNCDNSKFVTFPKW